MEDLGDILKRLATTNSSRDRPPDSLFEEPDRCDLCGGRGWVTLDVPVGHSDFGQIISCACQKRALEHDQQDRLLRYSNLIHMSRFTFESLDPEGLAKESENRIRFKAALSVAKTFCETPRGWLVFTGSHGSGKTHLAAAIGRCFIERGHVVFFSHVPDLLDHLRATFNPSSDIGYSDLFDQVRSTPLLILDGLQSHSTTPWAQEKLRQVINHRYAAELPTVITIAGPIEDLDEQILSRLTAPGVSHLLELGTKEAIPTSRMGHIEPEMAKRMTFEKFDIKGNNPTASQLTSLRAASDAARNYANDSDGWLTLSGDTGVGKTHLAVAVALECLKQGKVVYFAFVPELMDYLRYTFSPESNVTYDKVFEQVKNAPLLVLDDLGKEQSSRWAVEKLYQIVVHRHNARLPTVITSMMDFGDRLDPITSRVQDPAMSQLIKLDAPDYRNKQRKARGTGSKRLAK